MACCGCGNLTCRGPAGPAGPTSATVIFSQSDLPDPSGGVITLAADTTYWIAGDVTIDNGVAVQMSSGTCLIGNGKYCSRLIGNTNLDFLRGPAGADMHVEDLGVQNTGSGVAIAHDSSNAFDTHLINVLAQGGTFTIDLDSDQADLHNVDILATAAAVGLRLTNVNEAQISDILFDTEGGGDVAIGMRVSGAAVGKILMNGFVFRNMVDGIRVDATAVESLQLLNGVLDEASSDAFTHVAPTVITSLIVAGTVFDVPAAATGISGSGTVTDASVSGNVFVGAGTYLSGMTSQTDGWLFGDNVGVEDTAFIGELSFYNAGGLSVTGGAAPAGDIADTAAVQAAIAAGLLANFQADGVTGAKLEYTGNKNILVKITAELTGAITAGAAARVLQILVNDVAVGRQASVQLGGTGVFQQLSTSFTVRLNPGDIISANIDANITEMTSYHLTAVAAE